MGYELTAEDIHNSLSEDGINASQYKPNEMSYLEMAAHIADKYINKFIKNTRKYDKLWDDDEKQIERLGIND